MYIDSHAHLNDPRFFDQLPEVVARAHEAGVDVIVNIGTNLDSSWRLIEMAEEYPGLYATVGLHPHEAKDFTPAMREEFRQMAALEQVVAIGEVGLDFHYDNSPRPVQKSVFIEFLHLAAETQMPLVIHSREAEQATVEIIDEHMAPGRPAVLHCFGSDWNFARYGVERGFLFGVGGVMTFPNAEALRAAVERIPLEQIMLETDCPYLAPQQRRGRTNEPSFIPLIAEALAELKRVSVEQVGAVTTATARRFYGLEA